MTDREIYARFMSALLGGPQGTNLSLQAATEIAEGHLREMKRVFPQCKCGRGPIEDLGAQFCDLECFEACNARKLNK